MAKRPMKRIEIAGFMSDRKKVMERLQRRGLVEFSDVQEETVSKLDTSQSMAQFEKNHQLAVSALAVLNEYSPPKKPLLSFTQKKKDLEKHDFGEMAEKRNELLRLCYDLVGLQKSISEKRAAIVRIQATMDSLRIWTTLDIPIQTKGTKYSRVFVGCFSAQRTVEEILIGIAQRNAEIDLPEIELIFSSKVQTCLAVITHRHFADELYDILRQMGFVAAADPSMILPAEHLRQLEQEQVQVQSEIEQSIERIRSYENQRPYLEFTSDYFVIRREKYQALAKVGLTQKTFYIRGFIPEKYAEQLVAELESKYTIAVQLSEPGEGEDVPVLLENNNFSMPMEAITEMYALPSKRDIDPSAVMAFFYYFFFGIMLSDAGYGLLLVIGTAFLLKKYKIEGSMKKSLTMFFYCGISTVFWGAMFGSWFGDIVPTIFAQFLGRPGLSLAIWFDPVNEPIRFLMAAFVFGIVHLFVGVGVAFFIKWREGDKLGAILDSVPTYLLVLGAAPMAGSVLVPMPAIVSVVCPYLALSGLVMIILFSNRSAKNIIGRIGGGLYSLYSIGSGYLSDILSYSRLLALGLATGSIAGVINMMGVMPENPVVKAILLAVVFVIGHALNMAINVLGAYVHTNRLQFVEFFSKFYEGGGRAFDPLKVHSNYVKFKEEK